MTLTQLFTAIANQIRRIKGTSGTIIAENFPTEMSSIELGHLDNTEYTEANDDLDDILEGSTPMTIYPPDWSGIGYEDTPQSIIDGFNYAKDIKDNWDSSVTSFGYKYNNDKNILFFPLVDTSNFTNISQAFSYSNMQSMALIDTSKVIAFTQAFSNCYYLKDVPVLSFASVTAGNYLYGIFQNCSSLSNASLNNIMASCISATNISGTKTLRNLGLTSAQCTTCQGLSNYQAFLDAGWTTGY